VFVTGADDHHREGIVARGRSEGIAWVGPISPAGGITEYRGPDGLPCSDLYALDPPAQIRPHLDRARHDASTRQTG